MLEDYIYLRSPGHWTRFSRGLAHDAVRLGSTSRRSPWSKPVDHLKNAPEQITRHRDLRHFEGHVAPVDDELRADLHEPFPQAGQRPFLDAVRQRQHPQEVCKIVRKRVELQPHGVGGERTALQPYPLRSVLAFLDPLLGGTAPVVEGDDAVRGS
jgi:hypothetical protein